MAGGYKIALLLGLAGVLFILEMGYSIVLVCVASLSRVALHRLEAESAPRFQFLEKMHDPASAYRMAAALMRVLCLMGGALSVAAAARLQSWTFPALVGIATATILGVVLLEMVGARLLALWDPRLALRGTAFLVSPAYTLLWPIVRPLGRLMGKVSRIQQLSEEDREEEQEEEVEAFIEVGEREGILEANEGEMMRSIVDLDETRVREIMTPRPDVVALPLETTLGVARRKVLEVGHSRLPVYRETMDNVVGVLHERDLLRATEEAAGDPPIEGYLREVMFVPESLSVADLLTEMRVKTHIALVMDEYGGVAGLVTLEDLLEEIVGDIRDEHDSEEQPFLEESDGCWLVNASAHVDDLGELFEVEFDAPDFDTVGGLVVSAFGRVPAAGESIDIQGLRIEVVEGDRRRIRRIRVRAVEADSRAKAHS